MTEKLVHLTVTEIDGDATACGIYIRPNNNMLDGISHTKGIDDVMRQQQDLVKIVTRLEPLAVIKG